MGSPVNISSVDSIKNLKYFYSCYRSTLDEDLRQIDRQIIKNIELIEERKVFWLKEAEIYERNIREAEMILAGLLATNVYMPAVTTMAIPGYAVTANSIMKNRKLLNVVQENLDQVLYWLARVNEGYNEFKEKSKFLRNEMERVMPNGEAFLRKIVNEIDSYLHQGS